jgi:hypothetical protein
MKNYFRKLSLLLVAGMLLSTTAAQETTTPPDGERPAEQEQPITPVATPRQSPGDTFIPSETISEDLSVPFPVDI